MLIKEYRISLPMSVEEYRIAQLYMIQKKSREESHGAGSGVEIIENHPYTEGPGGNGQYTYKIYHIGSHLPGWFRAILPKSALRVEEEAWNAYPYTKTRYRCPFIEKFYIEIETKYLNDGGERENVFNMTSSELKERTIDFIDIVADPIQSGDYKKEEDPKLYQSKKTQRGPLNDNWRSEYKRALKDSSNQSKALMTSYKLCRVEFKYWGMQNKIERFIHDIGLRKTMLRAHRQAWCWQDEYYGLQLSDIRRLERETQLALQETMANANEDTDMVNLNDVNSTQKDDKTKVIKTDSDQGNSSPKIPISKSLDHVITSERNKRSLSPSTSSHHSSRSRTKQSTLPSAKSKSSLDSSQISDWRFQSLEQLQESSSDEDEFYDAQEDIELIEEKKDVPKLEKALSQGESGFKSRSSLDDPYESGSVFNSDFEHSDSDNDLDFASENGMPRSSSMETLSVSNDEFADARSQFSFEAEAQSGRRLEKLCQRLSLETGAYERNAPVPPLCKVSTLILVIHGGSLLDSACDHFNTSKRSDYVTLKATFDSVIKTHYPAARGHIAVRLVPCPQISAEALNVLSSISPFGFDAMTPSSTEGNLPWSQEFVPLGAVALFSSCNPEYQDHVNAVIAKSNLVYDDFMKSEEGKGFNGQVCLLSDATGAIMTYDALCRTRMPISRNGSHYGSNSSDLNEDDKSKSIAGSTHTLVQNDDEETSESVTSLGKSVSLNESIKIDKNTGKTVDSDKVKTSAIKGSENKSDSNLTSSSRQNSVRVHVTQSADNSDVDRRVSSGSQCEYLKFSFEVGDFFMLGSPLGLVLSYRRLYSTDLKATSPQRPDCGQIYNLFHASDPSAFRLEPLVNYAFKHIPPIKIARFNKYPMGDGESIQIVETMCHYVHLFSDQMQSGSPSNLLLSLQRQASVTSTCSQLSAFSSSGNNFSSVVNGQPEVAFQKNLHRKEIDHSSFRKLEISSKWWGNKRLDYMLYCPEVLHSFPVKALPPLFHASFWESTDVAAFVLRQILHQDLVFGDFADSDALATPMSPGIGLDEGQVPKEKWLKRRTMYKVKNLQPNHRGNDVIVLEDKPQILHAKFMYGPLDMTSLSGEKTDVHVMTSSGEWTLMGTEVTDGHGRLTFQIPKDKRLSQGIHPVKMVVRVDHTTADLFLAVLPAKTETVVFSIDGSFTASVSIMGKDPKVKPGAVDVVRHWQELGYLILYVTARPDMQHNKVQAWLAQHNFPHGMLAFMDGFSKDPLRQKFSYLRGLQTESELSFRAGYGSNKDINGYRELGLKKEQIFIVGKSNKKQQNLAMFISSGYAAHLEDLMQPGASRPASGNGIFLLRKSCFSLPSMEKRSSKRPNSGAASNLEASGFMRQESANPQTLISVNDQGNTMLQPVQPSFGSAVRARGTSPRPKMTFDPPR